MHRWLREWAGWVAVAGAIAMTGCAHVQGRGDQTGMKRITRDHTVAPQARHKERTPVAEVELGETFIVETINFRTPIIRSAEDANPKSYREREETGPVFVKGIQPGDILAIEILDIRPEGHASGGSADASGRGSFLEIRDGRVHFPGHLVHPLRMMIGDIRVQPAKEVANPWDYGGNMDFKDIAAGNTLLLKAELPGGLLVLGDVHAAQGDGEMEGVAAECAGEVTLRITKEAMWPVVRPTVRKANSFVSIACRSGADGYWLARDQAVEDATKILANLKGCTEGEARLYVRTVGDLRNGGVWAMGKKEPSWCVHLPLVVGVEVPLENQSANQPSEATR
jgi:amidase